MKRGLVTVAAALAAFGGCAHALAAATATATASVTIEQPAGVSLVTPLVLPTISTAPVINTPVATTSAPSSSGGPVSNAALTIYGQGGDAVSMAVPQTFQVIRAGGTESLTVKTNTNSQYDVAGNGVVLGAGPDASTMSVDVGGTIALASAEPLVPGPYEGMLVLVVQYN